MLLYTTGGQHMRYALAVVLVLLSTTASAQQFEVEVEEGLVPIVRVTGQPIALMCEGFVKEFGVAPETGMISVKPKTLPFGQNEGMGNIWVVRLGNKEVEVESLELPAPLRNLRGPVARMVLRGTCYTEEKSFFSTRDIAFVTANATEAQVVARVLRGQ